MSGASVQTTSCPQQYSVTAQYHYIADPDDPFEISFRKGDVLDIVDQQGKWWWVIKADGTVGPRAIELSPKWAGQILNTADGKDKNEISFTKGEVLVLLDQQGKWWQVKKVDGSVGYAPADHLSQDFDVDKRKSFSGEINGILGTSLWWQNQRADASTGLAAPDELAEAPIVYKYTAKARYTADAADPNEISFHKGEVLEIAHKRGRWWLARKANGTTGVAPSTFLEIISSPEYERISWW
ncbi:hypothetical protein B0H14DRAFT_2602294 [Mycena olivaceomarginata]|nr:hypothetical protein B0H14DRAFT_2602294 [Mycena olivaceomarginata]